MIFAIVAVTLSGCFFGMNCGRHVSIVDSMAACWALGTTQTMCIPVASQQELIDYCGDDLSDCEDLRK